MTHITCPDCGMPGSILPVPFSESETGYPSDLHIYQCGTRNVVNRETGEIDEARSRRSPACERMEALQTEIRALGEKVQRLIAERDEGEFGDEPF